MTGRFEGKVALVTGGASGLGEETARLAVAEGASVVIADYVAERGQAVAGSLGDKAVFVKCDVTNEADVAAAADTAISRWGRLDGCFANAGIVGISGPLSETPLDDFDKTMAVLVRGVFTTYKHAARVMIAAGNGGCIVATASVAGLMGGLGPHAYAMAKAGVIGLARSAAAELAGHRIRSNSIAPGSIPTGMTAHVITGNPEALDKAADRMAAMSPLKRAPHARDIAETVMFLWSDAGSYITGQNITVDAGVTTGAAMSATWNDTKMIVAR